MPTIGPTVWMTCFAGRLYPFVIFAFPVGSSCPCASIICAHSLRSWIPAAEWIALSMHPWHGTKHPSIWLFAAFTIASTESLVISPRQRDILSTFLIVSHGNCPPIVGSCPHSTIPFCSASSFSSSSWILVYSGSASPGQRTFIRLLRSLLLPV